MPADFGPLSTPLLASGTGYIQRVDYGRIMMIAERRDLLIKPERRIGEFVMAGERAGSMYPGKSVDEGVVKGISKAFILGTEKTFELDVEFITEQMLEMTLRALTEDINNPFNAETALDWLFVAFVRLAEETRPDIYIESLGPAQKLQA